MRKVLKSAGLLLLIPTCLAAQSINSDVKIVESIAENIMNQTAYDFIDPSTNNIMKNIDDNNYIPGARIRSTYNRWHYWNGVINIAFMKLSDYFDNGEYKDYVYDNYEFAFDNYDFFEKQYDKDKNPWRQPLGLMVRTAELDDCGAMESGLIEVYRNNKKEEYKDYIDKAAHHMLNEQERVDDGTFVRTFPHEMTLWGDYLYMSIVFLARMGDLKGDQKYFDDAARQVINFTKYLYNPNNGLYYHCWYSDIRENGVAHWGRCNGWLMVAQADLLEYLPENHPKRDPLISIFHQHILGISRHQDISGLWHQLIDKNDSYLETSATAMFTYSIAKGVNEGWIDDRYQSIAENGWEGIKSQIQGDGKVKNICAGTGIKNDLVFYYTRPAPLNDAHGLGAILLAGIEMLKLKDKDK